jgi:diaminopimelate decarboxylase
MMSETQKKLVSTSPMGVSIISDENLEAALRKWGNTLYICSLNKFKDNLSKFLQSFTSKYSDTVLGYSYKTNFLPQMCQMANSLGHYAEVVSEFEYDMALRFGVLSENIIYNGPAKSPASIERALAAGSKINLDSVREVNVCAAYAKQNTALQFNVGLRLNFSQERSSRFGVDPESDDFCRALCVFNETPNLNLVGLHCHANSPGRTSESYATRLSRMIGVARKSSILFGLDYLDLGGGFFGELEPDLAAKFPNEVPSFENYAKAITDVLNDQLPEGCSPTLILEPGVAVVANVMSFICQVESVKHIAGQSHAITSGGLQNMRPNLDSFDLPFLHYSSHLHRSVDPPVIISGYTCMEKDILATGYDKRVHEGDLLMFRNTGAYSFVFKPPFIRGEPPIVIVDESEKLSLARHKESVEDFLKCYNFNEI